MTDTPERALLRRLVAEWESDEARTYGGMYSALKRVVDDAHALLAAPPASEGEEYTVSGIVGDLVHIVMPDGFKPGDRVMVKKVVK